MPAHIAVEAGEQSADPSAQEKGNHDEIGSPGGGRAIRKNAVASAHNHVSLYSTTTTSEYLPNLNTLKINKTIIHSSYIKPREKTEKDDDRIYSMDR